MSLPPGSRLGIYEVIALIGSGGMGDVYRARDPRLEREVAIKTVRASSADDDARARLWREARAVASVNHPGICQIYDVGDADGTIFLVMELLDGEVEGLLVGGRRLGRAAHLAHVLERRSEYLLVRGRRLEVEQRSNVPAHDFSVAPPRQKGFCCGQCPTLRPRCS